MMNINQNRKDNKNITLKENENKDIFNTISNTKSNIFRMQYKIDDVKKLQIFGEDFVKNNQNNCKIIINGKYLELCKYIDKQYMEDDILEIELKEIKTITNMSYMFEGCESLLFLSEQYIWDTFKVTNMSYMFCGCKSLFI